MRRISIFVAAAAIASGAVRTHAVAGGDEVVVVYNSKMPESKALADYYAARREIPRSHIFGFEMSTSEAITRAEFRETLQQPLLEKLESSKLWTFGPGTFPGTNGQPVHVDGKLLESKIRYAVLCYGVPLKILSDPSLKSPGMDSIRPEFRRNEAAVDNELAWLPMVYQHLPLSGMLRNPFYTLTNAAFMQATNGVLMVTRLDGPTPEIARGLVDKAIQAETDGLWGRAYFDLRNTTDPGFKPGDDWIRGAAEICRVMGFETVVDNDPATFPASFPMSQIGFYCGWYDQHVSGPFTLPEVEFMPGAFAYHLHSYSATTIRSTNSNWVGPLLAKGATITMGCVEEPYLGGTPDVGVFAGRLVYYTFTFGESAYAAQPVLSWQTTIVGDPLYRPFGKRPQQLHQELEAKHSKLIEWSHLRVVNLGMAKGVRAAQNIGYLEQINATTNSAVLSEKLGDLCAALGKPSSAIHAYEQALNLDPSRQQRVRLRLTLGEKLLAAGQEKEAYEDYKKLVEEWPDHPVALSIYQKLLPMAKKLARNDDAWKWEEHIKRLTPPPAPPATNTLPPAGK
jgi:uncharacterized protein (TIGR03790 family)